VRVVIGHRRVSRSRRIMGAGGRNVWELEGG